MTMLQGNPGKKYQYLCFAENFCACYSFFYDFVNKGEQLCIEVKVSDEELALLLSKL
ncbi:zinc finger SWIM domain protein [Medicago truncatula]|uniref:Zinc finger SWIM domain protein n=1 Tax=Medicago truncatula TaxID=3880 RepID=G7L7V6_MEDTR|nr:zinc finger SWIM domain protein [Medicago truncatula]